MPLLFWPDKFNYANCRNTGTIAGDPAENNFVILLRLNPAFFERDFQIFLMTNIIAD